VDWIRLAEGVTRVSEHGIQLSNYVRCGKFFDTLSD
jgi:hypothetical protein